MGEVAVEPAPSLSAGIVIGTGKHGVMTCGLTASRWELFRPCVVWMSVIKLDSVEVLFR